MACDVSKVLSIAANEIGYLEKKSLSSLDDKTANAGSANYTKYWRDMNSGYQGEPWCNCFVNWCFVKAYGVTDAKKLLCTSGGWSYYTPTSAQYFKNNKQWYSTPKKGDVIYFKNSTRIHHVGIVEKVSGNTVYTIEGNTSGGSAVIANGGGVCRKSYNAFNTAIAGYGRPKYDSSFTPNWFKNGDNWMYEKKSGVYAKNEWLEINGRYYVFDGNGYAVKGWFKSNEGYYYLNPSDCALLSGQWLKDNGKWYFLKEKSGLMLVSDWLDWKGKTYYFDKTGAMATDCWVKSKVKEAWYYVDSEGVWIESKTVTSLPSGRVVI